MEIFAVILIFLMFAWAFLIAVQAKMNQSVKQVYRAFYDKGEIYFGKTSGYKITLPHVVAIVCCDKKGVILGCRCIAIRKIRGQPDIRDWPAMLGEDIHTLNPSDYSDEKHVLTALKDLVKKYKKHNPNAAK